MYDTVVLKLLKEDIGDKYDWRSVFNKIDQISEYKPFEGGSGHINGLRVTVTAKHVKVSGSLSKYFRGTNLDSLTLLQVEKAIKRLGKDLGVPMIKADVERVDMAENFEMSRPPEFYISKMQSLGECCPNKWKGTTYFPSNGVLLRFYDKSKEVRKKRKNQKNTPGAFSTSVEQNLLRYEICFGKKAIRRMFGHQLKAKDLYDKDIFWRLVSEWLYSYDEIGIISDKLFDVSFEQIKTLSDFEEWCICIAHSVVGLPSFVKGRFSVRERSLDESNGNKKDGQDRQYHKRIQDKIRGAMKHFSGTMGKTELMQELTDKIEAYLTDKFENSPDAYNVREDSASVK